MTMAVFVLTAALLIRAWIRRPQAIVGVLVAAWCASALLATSHLHGGDLRAVLTGIDALVVLAMTPLWIKYLSQRARFVALLGLFQTGLSLVAGSAGIPWASWAAIENATFVVQVIIAGGDLDGFGTWLGDRWNRVRAGGARLLGDVGR